MSSALSFLPSYSLVSLSSPTLVTRFLRLPDMPASPGLLSRALSGAASVQEPAFTHWGCCDKGPQSEMGMYRPLGGQSAGQGAGFFLNSEGSPQQALSEASRSLAFLDYRFSTPIFVFTVNLCSPNVSNVFSQCVPSVMSSVCSLNVPRVLSKMSPVCSPRCPQYPLPACHLLTRIVVSFWFEGPHHSNMMSPWYASALSDKATFWANGGEALEELFSRGQFLGLALS